MLPGNDFSWTHLALEAAMSAISGLAGLIFGAWRWGRASAKAEQAVKDDYDTKIDGLREETRASMTDYEKNATARNELLVEQFRESFEGIRRQIDGNLLEAERHFLQRGEFDAFRKEYREDQRRTDEKLDRLLESRR